MVPVDFHGHRYKVKQVILARLDSLSREWDPFVAAWIAYAISLDGLQNNPPLEELADRLERWAAQDGSWQWQRNLGPLAFNCWLQECMGRSYNANVITKLSEAVKRLDADHKLSLLRDAEQVFLLALGLRAAEDARLKLAAVSRQQVDNGPLRRRILYAAALREMGETVSLPPGDPSDVGDVIALAWWAERYPNGARKDEQWKRFAMLAEKISLAGDEAGESRRVLSVPELALLYEALSREASHPAPVLLFEYFPLHRRIREVATEHFRNGKYITAVEQACKVLNELIQLKSGVSDKNEAELVQATMKQISEPERLKIKFNNFLNEDSGRNEQAGLALICEGVFKAFRNPKGHKPEDHPLVQLDAYEALAQLVIINYLMDRIERAEVREGDR